MARAQGTIGLPPGMASADILPEGTLALLEIPDLGATRVRARDNVVYKICSDPQVKEYLKPVCDKLDEWFKKTDVELQAKIKLSLDDLQKLASGRLSIALTDLKVTDANLDPTAVLLLTPADPQHLNDCVARLLSSVSPEDAKSIRARMVQGTTIYEMPNAVGRHTLSWAVAGNTLVVGLGDKAVDEVLARMVEGGRCLSANATYMTVRDKMKDVSEDWMLYVSVEKLVQLLPALYGEDGAWADAYLNLQQFKALAIAGKLDGAAVDDAIYLHAPGQPGKAGDVVAPRPVDMRLLECVPADSASFCVTRLNLPLAYDTFVQALKELAPPEAYDKFVKGLEDVRLKFGVAVDDEIVRQLGEELVVYHVSSPFGEIGTGVKGAVEPGGYSLLRGEYGTGRGVLMLTVKDAAKIRQSLDALTDLLVAQIKLSDERLMDLEITHETYQGVELRVLNGFPNIFLHPAYAVTDRFLIVSGTPELVKQAIDLSSGRGRNITESDVWPAIKAQIPDGAGTIMAANSAACVEQARLLIQKCVLPSIRPSVPLEFFIAGKNLGFVELLRKDPAPLIEAANRNAFVTVCTVKTEPDGVMMRGRSAVGMYPWMITVPAAIVGLGDRACYDASPPALRCRRNLSQLLRVGMSFYRQDHNGEMPNKLEELFPGYMPSAIPFLCPLTGHKPAQPDEKFLTDYVYVGPLPADMADSNVVILRDRVKNHSDGYNYLECDGDVKWATNAQMDVILRYNLRWLVSWLKDQPDDVQKRVKAFYLTSEPDGGCQSNLWQLRSAISAFKKDHGERMPQTLEELLPRYVRSDRTFHCPSIGYVPSSTGKELQSDYEYLGILPAEFAPSNVVILRDKMDNHVGGIYFMECDLDVKWAPRERIETIFKASLDEIQPWLEIQPDDVQKRVKAFYEIPE